MVVFNEELEFLHLENVLFLEFVYVGTFFLDFG